MRSSIIRFWLPGADKTAAAERYAAWGVDQHHLRRLGAAAIEQLPDLAQPADQWCAGARQVLSTLRPTPGRTEPAGININCPRGKGKKAAVSLSGLGRPTGDLPATRVDTVHAVKGEETDAVLMLLPREQRTSELIARWVRGGAAATDPALETDEALRVLYVAVTRARRLVALALPSEHLPAVACRLTERGVPVSVAD